MMKGIQAQGIECGEDYRSAASAALKDVLEGCMAAWIDRHLAELARRGEADRRNGSYRRWLLAADGMRFPWWRNGSTISVNPAVIAENGERVHTHDSGL